MPMFINIYMHYVFYVNIFMLICVYTNLHGKKNSSHGKKEQRKRTG